MRALLVLVVLLSLVNIAETQPTRETEWSALLADEVGGEAEYRLPGGARIDIATEETAWEVEWCEKWPESIGQSLYYAAATNKKPGVWILKRGSEGDEDWNECLVVIQYLRGHGIDVQFETRDTSKGR